MDVGSSEALGFYLLTLTTRKPYRVSAPIDEPEKATYLDAMHAHSPTMLRYRPIGSYDVQPRGSPRALL